MSAPIVHATRTLCLPSGPVTPDALQSVLRDAVATIAGPQPLWTRRVYCTHPELAYRLRLEVLPSLTVRLVAARTGQVLATVDMREAT